jgi:hypothetical protein
LKDSRSTTIVSTGSRDSYESTGTEQSAAGLESECTLTCAQIRSRQRRGRSASRPCLATPLKQNQLVRAAHRALPVPQSPPVTA